ncbi:MAG: response regulator transcription factor, partial [Actinobacteria bacterium]|nr:response regulator transcription factor [Actinomycetota bacterium]NIU69341.1 response regulator transcription factor [Actinomycetota bacterium]
TATAGIDEVETVLVVEDEDAIRRFVVQMLRREGYRVLEAARPGDALLASEQEPGPIQLL